MIQLLKRFTFKLVILSNYNWDSRCKGKPCRLLKSEDPHTEDERLPLHNFDHFDFLSYILKHVYTIGDPSGHFGQGANAKCDFKDKGEGDTNVKIFLKATILHKFGDKP